MACRAGAPPAIAGVPPPGKGAATLGLTNGVSDYLDARINALVEARVATIVEQRMGRSDSPAPRPACACD